jgi:hypothetical protein
MRVWDAAQFELPQLAVCVLVNGSRHHSDEEAHLKSAGERLSEPILERLAEGAVGGVSLEHLTEIDLVE